METKDNVLDFPLAFSLRRGFSVENVLARCLEKLTGFKESIQLAWQKIGDRHIHLEPYLRESSSSESHENDTSTEKGYPDYPL